VTKTMSPDSTLADVLPSVKKQEAYVCGVLERLYACRRTHSDASVRIGVNRPGKTPYYQIVFEGRTGKSAKAETVFGSFTDSHKPLVAEKSDSGAPAKGWSSRTTTFEEVQELRAGVQDKKIGRA